MGGRTEDGHEVGDGQWLRVEKAGPLLESQAEGRWGFGAAGRWGTGWRAQLPSASEPALGVKPSTVPAPRLLFLFFLIRSNQSESEEPSFLLGSV